jgi:hypothetical protein
MPRSSRLKLKIMSLEDSVAAVLTDNGEVAGTAFLFRKGEVYHWFTCHHVIARLSRLRLGRSFKDGRAADVIEAEYVADRSDPSKDIAVLKTGQAEVLNQCVPLSMGEKHLGLNQEEKVTGIGFTPMNIKYFANGDEFPATLRPGQRPQVLVHRELESDEIRSLGNTWNIPMPFAKVRVFQLQTHNTPLDGGFSGSPVCVTTNNNTLLCVGMLCQASTRVEGVGFVTRYEELFSAAGTHIPFYPYADCVVLVLAAKLGEIEPHISGAHVLDKSVLFSIYNNSERDGWRCLDQETDIKSLIGQPTPERTWQLATVYLDDFSELKTFLKSIPGAVCFIVDCCSFVVPELKEIFSDADAQHYHAAYLFPMPDSRFTAAQKERLRRERAAKMPALEAYWVKRRIEECSRIEEFERRFEDLIERAVEVTTRLVTKEEMGRLLQQAGVIPGRGGRMPVFSVRNTQQ